MSRSVERALAILNLFDCHKTEWGISEISRELNLSKALSIAWLNPGTTGFSANG
jgi:hypothetical protein